MRRASVCSNCNHSLPIGKKYIAVQLITLETIYFIVEPKSRVNELFMQVCKYLNLTESLELFGLCIKSNHSYTSSLSSSSSSTASSVSSSSSSSSLDTNTNAVEYIFLDMSMKVSKIAPKQWRSSKNGVDSSGRSFFVCYFRVQFYVDSYLFLSDKMARHHYYLQMKENLVNYGLDSLSEERAFLLASISLQADLGNYNQDKHARNYFNPAHYFPSWIITRIGEDFITKNMPTMHKDLKGISRPEAESMYIKEATDPNGCPHNMHLYKLYKTSNNCTLSKKFNHYSIESKIWFGVCHNGVSIYGESKQSSLKTQISFFAWMDIGKLFFDKKKFEIRSVGFPIRKFTYFTSSEEISKNILWLCKITHRFQLMISPKLNEIKKREQELTRRKYRESYIYSGDENQLNCDLSYNVLSRDRVSKMSSLTQEEIIESCNKVGTSDNCKNETSERKGNSYSSCEKESLCSEQRVSVISNTSSNTTSGIMSDKVQSLEGDSEADDIVVDNYDTIDGTHSPFPPTIPHPHMSSIQAVYYSLESLAISDHSSGISGDMVRSSSSATEAVEHGSSSLSSVSPVSTSSVSTNGSSLNPNLLSKTDCKWYSNQESQSNIDDSKISNSGANSTRSTSSEQSVNTIKSTIPLSSSSSTLTGSTQLNNAFPSPSSLKSISTQDVQSVTNSPITAIHHETQSQRQTIEGQSCAKLETDEKERPPIRSESMNHIYENIPFHRSLNQQPPPPPPPLSSIPSPLSVTSRSATKIGVSSLNRFANQGSPTASTSALSNSYLYKLHNFYPQQNVAGSEPDLYNSKLWSPIGPVTCLPSDFQSLPGINSSYSCSIPDSPSCKATRALSDPTVLSPLIQPSSSSSSSSSHPLFAYSTIPTTSSNNSSQPTFHQSLNNISSSIELLKLVESDINVSDYPSIPPPQDYATNSFITNTSHLNGTKTSNLADDKPKSNSEEQLNINENQTRTENGQVLNLQQIKQKSQNIDLPLITALFNDRSLMLPKTVPTCSRQRYVANIRVKDDTRRYSSEEPYETLANTGSLSASTVDDELNSDKVTSIPITEGENKTVIEIVSNKSLSGNNRPISWHQDNRYNLQLNDNCIQKKSNPRADFIEKLWSEHFLN